MTIMFFFNTVTAISTPSNGTTPLYKYCPAASDLTTAYGNTASIYNQGWNITGDSGVATKSAFNLLGGSVSFTLDLTDATLGVNANIYTIGPNFAGKSFNLSTDNCNGQGTPGASLTATTTPWCVEVDFIESNGNCAGQSTLHTFSSQGPGCSDPGCQSIYNLQQSRFNMTFNFGTDGTVTGYQDNTLISITPAPKASDYATIASSMKTTGAVIYATQWVGYVPGTSTCSSKNASTKQLSTSSFSISNLVITGQVVQGPQATLCK